MCEFTFKCTVDNETSIDDWLKYHIGLGVTNIILFVDKSNSTLLYHLNSYNDFIHLTVYDYNDALNNDSDFTFALTQNEFVMINPDELKDTINYYKNVEFKCIDLPSTYVVSRSEFTKRHKLVFEQMLGQFCGKSAAFFVL